MASVPLNAEPVELLLPLFAGTGAVPPGDGTGGVGVAGVVA
jgi:hypothetical protein